MTKQENVRAILESMFPELKDELIDIAVKNIMELKHAPDEDAISRKAVLEQAWTLEYPDSSSEKVVSVKDIEQLPSVTPSRHKGHWIPIPYQLDYDTDAICSLCHEEFIAAINYKYCPNCGAKMEDNENDTI